MLEGSLEWDDLSGELICRHNNRVLRFRAWPDPAAFAGTSKHACRTPFEPRHGFRDFESRAWTTDTTDKKVVPRFLRTIPRDEKTAISEFQEFMFRLLELIWSAREPALEMLESSPALAFAVALAPKMKTTTGGEGWKTPAELAGMKRKAILEWLEFPSGKATAKLLARVSVPMITLKRLRLLRALLHANDERTKALRHAGSVNIEVLELVSDPVLYRHVTPRFIEEVREFTLRDAYYCERLRETIHVYDDELETPCPRFDSVAKLDECYDSLLKRTARKRLCDLKAQRPMRPPPIEGDGNIIPLDTFALLLDESEQQNNCARRYYDAVNAGGIYLYRVLEPERCTLSIVRSRRGWRVKELKIANNLEPTRPETYRAVRRWLSQS